MAVAAWHRSGINETLDAIYSMPGVKINVGCGTTRIDGALHVDLHPSDEDVICLDMRSMNPLPCGFADLIVAHQVIEHIPIQDVKLALKEFHRILVHRGVLVISTPDLDGIIDIYRDAGPVGVYSINKMLFGKSNPGMDHQCVLTRGMLCAELSAVGFTVTHTVQGYPPAFTPSVCIIATKEEASNEHQEA